MNKRFVVLTTAAAVALLVGRAASADDAMSADVVAQMQAMASVKANLGPAEKKLASGLAFGILAASGDTRVVAFRNAITPIATTDLAPATADRVAPKPSSQAYVDVKGTVSDDLVNAIVAAGGKVLYKSERFGVINATLPIGSIVSIAGRADVQQIRGPSRAKTAVGALTSQGYISHEANKAVAAGYNGSGVTVGVLSDSALAPPGCGVDRERRPAGQHAGAAGPGRAEQRIGRGDGDDGDRPRHRARGLDQVRDRLPQRSELCRQHHRVGGGGLQSHRRRCFVLRRGCIPGRHHRAGGEPGDRGRRDLPVVGRQRRERDQEHRHHVRGRLRRWRPGQRRDQHVRRRHGTGPQLRHGPLRRRPTTC